MISSANENVSLNIDMSTVTWDNKAIFMIS